MPTTAVVIEYLNELVNSAPIDKDALPCRKFETAVVQARFHMAAHILNIIYDDTPSTQMATLLRSPLRLTVLEAHI
jgi:hypothetical protein